MLADYAQVRVHVFARNEIVIIVLFDAEASTIGTISFAINQPALIMELLTRGLLSSGNVVVLEVRENKLLQTSDDHLHVHSFRTEVPPDLRVIDFAHLNTKLSNRLEPRGSSCTWQLSFAAVDAPGKDKLNEMFERSTLLLCLLRHQVSRANVVVVKRIVGFGSLGVGVVKILRGA